MQRDKLIMIKFLFCMQHVKNKPLRNSRLQRSQGMQSHVSSIQLENTKQIL